MKLTVLDVQDFMRVKTAHLDLAGRSYIPICGDNEAGKSSLINGLWWLLGGRDFPHDQVVREGADRARVFGNLGEIIVEKVQCRGGEPRLEVRSPDGSAVYLRPQKLLDDLLSKIAFDPQAFALAKSEDQAAMIRPLVGIDWTDLDKQRLDFFTARSEAAREVKRLEGVLSALVEAPEGTPDAEVSVAALLEEQKTRMRAQDERTRRGRALTQSVQKVQAADEGVRLAHEALEAAERRYAEAAKVQQAALEAYQLLPEPDVQAITDAIGKADQTNQAVRQKRTRQETVASLEVKRDQVSRLAAGLEAIVAEKRRQVAAATFPLEGLGFSEDGLLTYGGLPFTQAADSAKLRVGVALGIALSPKFPVLLIRQGSLLDTHNLEMIRDMVEAADAQVLLEIVGAHVEDGFWIEDGEVVTITPAGDGGEVPK